MSYLDVPRLHFSGLFFTGPSTINNILNNFDPSVPLEDSAGVYQSNAGWNALGVAQWWLEQCTVLSAVGSNGAPVPSSDSVIGAAVQSPSPKTPMSDGKGGYFDMAKMVDLDPSQQGRSALYGVRIAVVLPNGAGFQGLMSVPELRQLNGRIANVNSSYGAVGNWMGTLLDVVWSGDISSSPFLTSLKAASPQALNVKLTVDLHQNDPTTLFTSGNQFCYGRVLASIGPAAPSELPQVVPGRCLQTVSTTTTPSAAVTNAEGKPLPAREQVAAKMVELGKARAARATESLTAATSDPWNPAFAIIRQVGTQTLLSIDIGGCIYLNMQGTTSDGTFEVDSGIVVGVFNTATSTFTPFANGSINIAPQYQQLNSTPKNCVLVKNSCVFSFPITTADGNSYENNPLAIQVNGTTVAQEYSSGYWIDVSVSSQRLECGPNTAQSQIMVRKFGAPVVGPTVPVTAAVRLWDGPSSTDIGASFGPLDANGLSVITTKVYANKLTLPPNRQPLDSQVYYVYMHDSTGKPIGDGNPFTPALSVLLFNAYIAPTNPTWNDVSAIFGAYARLYPGMKSRLDISDQATVVGDVDAVLAHMVLPIIDPAYMPVTRDLSPSKMNMIVTWLKQQAKP